VRRDIVFISAFHTPFIQDDLDLLEKHYTVRKRIGRGIPAVLKIVPSMFLADAVFCWFASVYAFVGVFSGPCSASDRSSSSAVWMSPRIRN